jgi:thiol-disulfide isomerase/thioredoxin
MRKYSFRLFFAGILLVIFPLVSNAEISIKQTIDPLKKPVPAPDYVLHDLNDKVHKLSELRGYVVAVNFWATWCPPCRKELPSMERAYKALRKDGLRIVGINVGEKWDTVAPFLEDFSITYPILLDTDSSAMSKWSIIGLPTTFFVDRQGRITHRINGGRNWDDTSFRRQLESMLKKSAGAKK